MSHTHTHAYVYLRPGDDDDDDFAGESEMVIARNIVLLKYCISSTLLLALSECANINYAWSLELHD